MPSVNNIVYEINRANTINSNLTKLEIFSYTLMNKAVNTTKKNTVNITRAYEILLKHSFPKSEVTISEKNAAAIHEANVIEKIEKTIFVDFLFCANTNNAIKRLAKKVKATRI